MPGIDEVNLISLEESLKEAKFPEEIEGLKRLMRGNKDVWITEKELRDKDLIEREEIEEDSDFFEDEELYDEEDNLPHSLEEVKPVLNTKPIEDFYKNGYTIVAFDESSQSIQGAYARLTAMKFGECHQLLEGNKWKLRKYTYKPTFFFVEDTSQKIVIYKKAIREFVETILSEFNGTELEEKARLLIKWYKKIFVNHLNKALKKHKYKIPPIGRVIDRIRTADEALRSILRMKELQEQSGSKYIFLGDGMFAFRAHIFPPKLFTHFFQEFIKKYDIKYFTYSKTCLLRDELGRFYLPFFREIFPKERFFIHIPQKYSKSRTFLVRLQEHAGILRFDVPAHYKDDEALKIHQNIIPYAPMGYPVALLEAHRASQLLSIERTRFRAKFLEIQENPQTRTYIDDLRSKFIPP
ncbi:MAG: DNA double-strand break repair nuclease NurA [Candidatus Helarchaeales archaeon]